MASDPLGRGNSCPDQSESNVFKGKNFRIRYFAYHSRPPGNVRELENITERSVIMARGDIITPDELPETLRSLDPDLKKTGIDLSPGRSLKAVEKEMILRTLEDANGNRTHAAKILGISRRTLQLKLKEYGIR